MSVDRLGMKTIERMPTLLGEVEIIRSLQLLPGSEHGRRGVLAALMFGAAPLIKNLVLLDEAPVYNSSHLFGFFSVF